MESTFGDGVSERKFDCYATKSNRDDDTGLVCGRSARGARQFRMRAITHQLRGADSLRRL